MSTKSILARPTTDGGWEGRYCHWDGYPTHQARVLLGLVAGAGGDVDRIRRYLVNEHTGWSRLGGDWHQPAGYVAPAAAPDPAADPSGWARHQRRNQCYCHGDRHEIDPLVRSRDPVEVEWVDVLDDQTLRVLHGEQRDRHLTAVEVACLPWGTSVDEAALLTIECGGDLQRCRHVAEVHFPGLDGTDSGGLSTAKWLGREPLGFHDVTAVVIGGRRYTVHGGRRERRGRSYGDRWFGYLRTSSGDSVELPIALLGGDHYRPAPGVVWVYPPTKPTTVEPDPPAAAPAAAASPPPVGSTPTEPTITPVRGKEQMDA